MNYNQDNQLKTRTKLYKTCLLLFLFFVFEYIFIFHSTRFRPYTVFAMFGAWITAIVLWGMWVNRKRTIKSNSSDFATSFKYLLINATTLLLVLAPIIYLSFKSVDYVQDYQLKKHGVHTSGLVTAVTKNTESGEATFNADFSFRANNKKVSGFSVVNENDYNVGDSVLILYSSEDVNLQRIEGKIKYR